jgi:hypothetical protein
MNPVFLGGEDGPKGRFSQSRPMFSIGRVNASLSAIFLAEGASAPASA